MITPNLSSSDAIKSITTIEDRSFYDNVVKIDRLLRLNRMLKNNELPSANEVKERINTIMKQMEKQDTEKFHTCQETIRNYVTESLIVVPKKVASSKMGDSISNNSSVRQQDIAPMSAFGSSMPSKINIDSKSSNSMVGKGENSKNETPKSESIKNSQKQQKIQQQKKPQKSPEKSYQRINIDFNKKQSSAQISGSISGQYKTNVNLRQFCQVNGSIIEQKIAINEQVVTFFKTQSPDKVTLLGVQKPYDKNAEKLYICTYMEFNKDQVTSMKFKAKDYQNQLDQFLNVIRFPLALCVIGQSIIDMKVHYVKFLLQMTSPLPLIIIFNQVAPEKSLLIRMTDKALSLIQGKNIIEMDSLDSQINMKDRSKYKCINFKQIPIVKERCVTTKPLYRKQTKQIIQNDQAIMVEKPNKVSNLIQTSLTNNDGTSSVSQVPVEFQYVLHFKFMISSTNSDFYVYTISQQKQLNVKKKVKDLKEAVQFIKNSDRPCALGCIVKNADKRIIPELFVSQLKVLEKCPMIIVRLKSLTVTKVAFLTIKPQTTQGQLNEFNISFKDIEGNAGQVPNLFHVMLCGQKNQIAKYQGKSPLTEI